MDTSQTVAMPSASEVPRIRGLIRRREFTEALSAGEALLADTPDERDALLFVAIAQRYLGRISAALATLARLERHSMAQRPSASCRSAEPEIQQLGLRR